MRGERDGGVAERGDDEQQPAGDEQQAAQARHTFARARLPANEFVVQTSGQQLPV